MNLRTRLWVVLGLGLWLAAWWWELNRSVSPRPGSAAPSRPEVASLPINAEMDFPVRPPDGAGAWITAKFEEDYHLGEDWNTGPGDEDLGEPVYSCGDGWVVEANDYRGVYGKVVILLYRLSPSLSLGPAVEMLYANLQTLEVETGQAVRRGQKIGTMGNAEGTTKAHLHWEVRSQIGLGLGAGYDLNSNGWLSPRKFILKMSAPWRECQAKELSFDQYESWGKD